MHPLKNISMLVAALGLVSVVGCRALDNDVTVGEAIDDAAITTKVKAALVADDDLKARDIHVSTADGVVQLTGEVSERSDIAKATKVADDIQGVKAVRNNIVLK